MQYAPHNYNFPNASSIPHLLVGAFHGALRLWDKYLLNS